MEVGIADAAPTEHTAEEPAPPSVLLVDDDPRNLLALEAVLSKNGCRLVSASSGPEALRHLLREDFALVLLDVMMPGMSGFEVAERIRTRPRSRDLPIVFLTALAQDDDMIRQGYRLGAVDYLLKPLNPTILTAKVAALVGATRDSRASAERARRLAAALAESEADAQRLALAGKASADFSQTVAHELRAHLHGVSGFGQLLLLDCEAELGATGRQYLERLIATTERMGGLIDALLALCDASHCELCTGPVDLSELASRVAADLHAREPERRVLVEVAPDLETTGDERLLHVVLENLLRNAWKYTGPRTLAQIEVGSSPGNAQSTFFVRDNGVGFDPRHAGELFREFRRLHPRAQFSGSGIGLATVRRIVERHGGHVWAEAAVDRGATFYFTIGDAQSVPGSASQVQGEEIARLLEQAVASGAIGVADFHDAPGVEARGAG